MDLKVWENNLEESKRLAKEEKEACIDALSLIYLEMARIDVTGIHDTLRQVEIKINKQDLNKNRESVQNAIL